MGKESAVAGAALLAGLASSVSPCAAARAAALCGIVRGSSGRERIVLVLAFAGGLGAACLAIVSSISLWRLVVHISSWAYAAISATLLWLGAKTLFGAQHSVCRQQRLAPVSTGASFLTGAALGFVGSPCCMPVIAFLASMAAVSATRVDASVAAVCFTIGHVAPLLLTAKEMKVPRLLPGMTALSLDTIAGSVLISMGAYYALLA